MGQMQGYREKGYRVALISFQRDFRESPTEEVQNPLAEGTMRTVYRKGTYATHFNAVHGYAKLLKDDADAEHFLLEKDFLVQAEAAADPAFHSGKQNRLLKDESSIGFLSNNGPDLFVNVNVDDEGSLQSLRKQA